MVAASAGGVEALQALLASSRPTFPRPCSWSCMSPRRAAARCPGSWTGRPVPRRCHGDGEQLRPGRIYVAPPDMHMLVVGNTVRLSHGPRQSGHRPAADPLFCSAALAAGPRVIAVVLSGTLDDGAAGCAVVERRGGMVAIQDPEESAYEGMPRAAIARTSRAVVLKVRQIAEFLDEQSRIQVAAAKQAPDHELERYVTLLLHPLLPTAEPETALSCPECGGALRAEHEGTPSVRYKCAFGHSWSPVQLCRGTLRRGRACPVVRHAPPG